MRLKDCRSGMFVKSLLACEGLHEMPFKQRRWHIAHCHRHSILQIVRVIHTTATVMVVGCQVRQQSRDSNIVPFNSAILLDPMGIMLAPEGR